MQEPCKFRGNENACRRRVWRTGLKEKRQRGVKKDDTVEKSATGGRRYKVQESRKSEIRSTKSETIPKNPNSNDKKTMGRGFSF
jgi:hypothetical protein